MPKVGIEPTYPRVHDFESCASACSATPARCSSILANPFAGQEIPNRRVPTVGEQIISNRRGTNHISVGLSIILDTLS